MHVLLTGATGFIGGRLAQALRAAGHELVCTVRSPARAKSDAATSRYVAADFVRDDDPQIWARRLAGIDAVINTVGILREHGDQTFEAVHVRTPQALFAACADAGVSRVIQFSALGADEHATSGYHISKRRADEFLSALALDWTVVQPSLVYGAGGTSARLFTGLASLPCIPLPGDGRQLVQPIHIDDVIAAILVLLHTRAGSRTTVPLVGPEPVSFRDFLGRLRAGMGLGRPCFVPIAIPVVRWFAALQQRWPGSLLDADTLNMLLRGSVAQAQATEQLLGHRARSVDRFIAPGEREAVRTMARLQWLLPALRWSVAFVWIFTGIVSLGIYPVEASRALLARVGVNEAAAPVMLYGAATMDLAFGLATLLMRRRRALWIAQAAVITGYTAIITVSLPEFWIHPFGPILKNVPLLAAIAMLYHLEQS